MEVAYFFDTYAYVELLRGNPAYVSLTKGVGAVTTKLNLLELHHTVLLTEGLEVADAHYDAFLACAVPIKDKIFKEASNFRFLHKKKDLSYVDCIGYVMARKLGIPLLTGDKAFEGMPGVEFVK
ncbi:MAG: PIN domain-containing protein [Nanoarchaeota archaeon]